MQNTPDNPVNQLRLLIQKSLEDSLEPEEIVLLQKSLLESRENRQYYIDYMMVHSGLFMISKEISGFSGTTDIQTVNTLLSILSEQEGKAPAVVLSEKKAAEELIFNVRQRKQQLMAAQRRRRINTSFLAVTFGAIAALLFMVVYLKLTPSVPSEPVATVIDCINARYSDDQGIAAGSRLTNRKDHYSLTQGIIEIEFDYGARVVIESPAEFKLKSAEKMVLNFGQAYAKVPAAATGFIIDTPNSRVIDLGTEFGVQVDIDRTSSVHMFKGKVSMISIQKERAVGSQILTAGHARSIDLMGNIKDIPLKEANFARAISSDTGFVWRGQKDVDLADIVGGGNGFGAGKAYTGIDPASGKPSSESIGMQQSANDFRAVPSSPYIDGVFIPNGRTQQVVSSQGHLFSECPATEGACFNMISYRQGSLDWPETPNVGSPAGPFVMMHANTGITFDLQAIRRLLPENLDFVRFQSKIGIEKGVPRQEASNADFWVLVDGQLRYQKSQVKAGELYSVAFDLSRKDRFLTLVITDGQDPEDRIVNGEHISPIDCDWGIFAEPRLEIERK